ncbi:MAG: HXXEE domain-containing protein [Pseudomonadales bacterium]|jgi:hypothetical protein
MISLLPPALALGLVALWAVRMTVGRSTMTPDPEKVRAAAHALAVTAGIQAVHFSEELSTGFHERLPALFGLPPMSLGVFVGFNLVWIGIWSVSVAWLRTGHPFPLFAAWFLAIAGCANGIVHPLLSLLVGGYFPGLVTSPFIGLAGLWLWRRLSAIG